MNAKPRPSAPRPPDEDEIEILEVVGFDEDPPAPPADEIEVSFEDDGSLVPEPAAAAGGAPKAAETEARERYLRLYADFENLKKRVERERLEHRLRATESLLGRLLPVLDNFERALAARGGEDSLRSGVQMIYRQLFDELRREGLRPVEALGQAFDPTVHEAVATTSDSGLPAHTVVGELQRGYFFGDRLLRPSLVRVQTDDGAAPGPAEPEQEI
ncbi:MAG TPA: nucleotide exchange factor GrpE [Candidatus Polarisedimenticolaceae bacterium]|nr:nucleotide exchange factor GrpE [Candidatus Polarisedimenticolaceae bacterium]